MKTYKSCSDLPIYYFYKVLKTSDPRYLIIDWDEMDFKKHIELDGLWEDIYCEYQEIVDDNAAVMTYNLTMELALLEARYEVVRILLNGVQETAIRKEYIDLLNKYGYKFDETKDFNVELARLVKRLKISQNKINIKRAELEMLTENNGESVDLIEQVVNLEQALERNEIDPKRTSCKKWIMLFKAVEKKHKLRKSA